MTKLLRINPVNPEMEKLKIAAKAIIEGGTVAFPTETVYGIGADAFNSAACGKIFSIKQRPSDNPLIVHISRASQLEEIAADLSDEFMRASKILWPGPVTFILKKRGRIPDEVSAGLDTIAVRMPAHPIALGLIELSGTPIAAPSANISTMPSTTRVEHVLEDLKGRVDVIIDGGETAFGIESTIINMTTKPYALLRPGAFTVEELEKYLGKIKISRPKETEIAIAPGMKYRHYAPKKRLIAVKEREELIRIANSLKGKREFAVLCSNETARLINAKTIALGSGSNLYEIAKNLFDSFRRLDRMDVEFGLIESFPEKGIGFAIMNRISKASSVIGSVEELEKATD